MEIIKSNIVDNIDVEPKHLEEIKRVLARTLPYKKVWAYGSRVKWTANERSDLDLAVFDATDTQIENAKEAFNESNVPFIVQLMNWQNIPNDFKKNIEEKYFVLQTEEDWAEFRLGDVADVINGYAFKSNNFTDEKVDGSLPVIKIKNVVNGDVNLSDVQYHQYTDELKKFLIKKGDILLALTGNHPHALTQVVGQASFYKLEETSLLNQRVAKIAPKPVLSNAYLYNFLVSSDVHEYLASQSSGSANQANISKSDIENVLISLPPLPEQKAIAEVLTSLDDKIDLLHKQNKTLEQLAETLFRHHFIDNAQDDWEEGKLGDLTLISSGKGLSRDNFLENGLYPVLGANGVIGRTNEFLIDERLIYTGRVGTLGNVFISNGKVWLSDNTLILRPKNHQYFFFVYFFIKNQNFLSHNVGSTQPLIRQSDVKNLDLAIPPDSKIIECSEIFESSFAKIEANIEKIKNLEKLRDQLLPKLMSGEILINKSEDFGND